MRDHLLTTSSHAAMRAERESAAFMARIPTGTAVLDEEGYLTDVTRPPRLVPRGWGASELRRLAAAKQ